MTFSCFVFCKSVYPLVLRCKNCHFVLKFQVCYITIKDSLWYVILHNYLLKIPWHLVRNHMISRSWFSCSLHVVEAHMLLKIFKPSFTGTVAVLLTPVSAKHLYSHKIFSLPTVSLTVNLSMPHLPSHTQKVLSTVLRKGSQRHTQWNTSLNDPLISSQNSLTGSGSCSFSKGSCATSLWHCSKLYWCQPQKGLGIRFIYINVFSSGILPETAYISPKVASFLFTTQWHVRTHVNLYDCYLELKKTGLVLCIVLTGVEMSCINVTVTVMSFTECLGQPNGQRWRSKKFDVPCNSHNSKKCIFWHKLWRTSPSCLLIMTLLQWESNI